MKKSPKGKNHKIPLKTTVPAKSNSAGRVNYPSIEKMLEGKGLYVFLALALLLAFFIFRNFISFKDLYLYKDIGSDTVTQWWPHWVCFSNYIHTVGIPKWSFNQGMGQNIFAFGIGDPFSLVLCLLLKDNIPYAIIFMELIKIIGGGLIFYLYLRTINCSLTASITGGLLYSFSGYMILGSGWYLVSTEAFYAVMVLYSAERFLRHGIWYLLPIPFCLLGAIEPFYLYLYGLLVTVYCIVWNILGKPQWKKIMINLFEIGGLAVFGVLLGSVVTFPNIYQLIDNPRVGGGASQFKILSATPMFQLSPSYINATTISRLFSNDLMGAGSGFKGWGNYLEAPILYIGLLTLLLAPQAFLFFNKRKRKIFVILTSLCLVPLVFNYFRYMFWLFTVPYFRSYTFFLSLLILFFAVKALTEIDRTGIVHFKTLIITLIVLLFLLYHNFSEYYIKDINNHLRNVVAIFLVLYAGLIYLISNKKMKLYAISAIGLCLCIELASFSNITVNKRIMPETGQPAMMNSSELTEKTGYNDFSVEALASINSHDAGFFRIAKDYYSNAAMHVCLNDAEIQGYNGLSAYIEWNQPNYYKFLKEIHASNWADTADQISSKWIYGPTGRFLIYSFASVKYLLSKQKGSNYTTAGYIPDGSFGDVKVFKNMFFLPLGFSYKKYISLAEFRKIKNLTQKDIMLLNAFVPDDSNIAEFKGIEEQTAKDTVTNLTYNLYQSSVNELKKDTLTISFFDQNNIKGTTKSSEKELLFFSIPYDKGWHANIDSKPAETYKANIGFTGLLLNKGEHTVELYYNVPYLALGTYTSAFALLLYAFAFIKFRKTRIMN